MFKVADGEIYILRWTGKEGKLDIGVFSTQGELLKSGEIKVGTAFGQ